MILLSFEIPMHTVSEANRASHEHWRDRHGRTKEQRTGAWARTLNELKKVPADIREEILHGNIEITITRISPGELDEGNLSMSVKAPQDGLIDAVNHGQDRDKRLSWHYKQIRGGKGKYAVLVEIARQKKAMATDEESYKAIINAKDPWAMLRAMRDIFGNFDADKFSSAVDKMLKYGAKSTPEVYHLLVEQQPEVWESFKKAILALSEFGRVLKKARLDINEFDKSGMVS